MPPLEIKIYNNAVLKGQTHPVEKIDDALRQLIRQMAETMYSNGGIGLAANQVGISKCFFIADLDWREHNKNLRVFINPQLEWNSPEDSSLSEGCLSLPNIQLPFYRPSEVRLKFQDLDGQWQQLNASGLFARVIQHELDHLKGVLIIDHVGFGRRALIAGQLARLRRLSKTQSPDPCEVS